jgi:hypothetical protein
MGPGAAEAADRIARGLQEMVEIARQADLHVLLSLLEVAQHEADLVKRQGFEGRRNPN